MKVLVLSGGGAGGAFQAGAILALDEMGHQYDVVVGTSVGALNAAGIRWLGPLELYRHWLGIKGMDELMKTRWGFYLGLTDSMYSIDGLKKTVKEVLSKTPHSETRAIACSLDILSGEVKYTDDSEADYFLHLIASSCVPLYMPPQEGRWVDGGVREHTPLKYALSRFPKAEIHCVVTNELVDESRLKVDPPGFPFKAVKIGLQATEWLQREVFLDDNPRNSRVTWIAPVRRMIDTFEFDPVKIRAALVDGHDTALRVFNGSVPSPLEEPHEV